MEHGPTSMSLRGFEDCEAQAAFFSTRSAQADAAKRTCGAGTKCKGASYWRVNFYRCSNDLTGRRTGAYPHMEDLRCASGGSHFADAVVVDSC
jgi:hypothetical protein